MWSTYVLCQLSASRLLILKSCSQPARKASMQADRQAGSQPIWSVFKRQFCLIESISFSPFLSFALLCSSLLFSAQLFITFLISPLLIRLLLQCHWFEQEREGEREREREGEKRGEWRSLTYVRCLNVLEPQIMISTGAIFWNRC